MIAPPFPIDDIAPLTNRAREVMLDLVLAWGELDGAISMLVAASFGLDTTRGSILLGRAAPPDKLLRLKRLYQAHGNAEMVKRVTDLRAAYEHHSAGRNLVAHSKCVGVRASNPEHVVFATFEVTTKGELAIDEAPLSAMEHAIRWAKSHTKLCLKIADDAGLFVPVKRTDE